MDMATASRKKWREDKSREDKSNFYTTFPAHAFRHNECKVYPDTHSGIDLLSSARMTLECGSPCEKLKILI